MAKYISCHIFTENVVTRVNANKSIRVFLGWVSEHVANNYKENSTESKDISTIIKILLS